MGIVYPDGWDKKSKRVEETIFRSLNMVDIMQLRVGYVLFHKKLNNSFHIASKRHYFNKLRTGENFGSLTLRVSVWLYL